MMWLLAFHLGNTEPIKAFAVGFRIKRKRKGISGSGREMIKECERFTGNVPQQIICFRHCAFLYN